MLSSGQLPGEWEPTPSAMLEEGTYEVECSNRRTNVLCLLPNGFQERKLRKLANLSAKLLNQLNYESRQQFLQRRVDFKATWDEYYEQGGTR